MTTDTADASPATDRPVALITGGGTGIGRAAAILLARGGHRVALVGRREAKLRDAGKELGTEGEDWIAVPGDIADPAQAAGVVDGTVGQFGRLDALVNNAGWSPLTPIGDQTAETTRQIFDINAVGPIITIQHALPELLKHRGVVVNVSSVATFDPFPGLGVYAAAKCAMNGIALALRNEYGDQGIRAFTVAPGAVETDLLRSLIDKDTLPEAATLTPEEVAQVIVACVTGSRSEPSGSTIRVDSP